MAPCFCFWRGHHALLVLRPLLFLALLHRLNCLAFLAACAPVLLLTAFLLGVVLVHSDDDHSHLYKKIRHHHRVITSSSDDDESSSSSSEQIEEDEEEEHHGGLVAEQEEEEDDDDEQEMMGKAAAVAWTADDERSIESIGSLELERDARLEKLMFRRSSSSLQRRSLIDLDVHIPDRTDIINKGKANDDSPGSAPSSLHRHNPLFQQRDKEELLSSTLTRHESFTAAAAAPLNRPSRFKPYFVAADDDTDGGIIHNTKTNTNSDSNYKKSSSSSSTSPVSSSAGDHQKQQQQTMVVVKQVQAEEAAAPAPSRDWDGNRMGMAVDVELISDSSDDDMSLPGGDVAAVSIMATVEAREHLDDDDEDDSFEVASITQQVAAAGHHHRQQHHEQDHHHRQHEQDHQPHMYASGPSPSRHQHQHQYQQEDGGTAWVAPMEKEKQVSEIRKEHHVLPPVPIVVDSSSSPAAGTTGADAGTPGATAGAPSAGAGRGAAAGSSSSGGKSSIKFKAPSKKAVLGFFRK